VVNNLSSLTTRRSKTEAINNVIKTSLEKNEKFSSRNSLCARSKLEGVAELGLKKTVGPLYLLLLTKLNLVV
jgi:hypothetical protein